MPVYAKHFPLILWNAQNPRGINFHYLTYKIKISLWKRCDEDIHFFQDIHTHTRTVFSIRRQYIPSM